MAKLFGAEVTKDEKVTMNRFELVNRAFKMTRDVQGSYASMLREIARAIGKHGKARVGEMLTNLYGVNAAEMYMEDVEWEYVL